VQTTSQCGMGSMPYRMMPYRMYVCTEVTDAITHPRPPESLLATRGRGWPGWYRRGSPLPNPKPATRSNKRGDANLYHYPRSYPCPTPSRQHAHQLGPPPPPSAPPAPPLYPHAPTPAPTGATSAPASPTTPPTNMYPPPHTHTHTNPAQTTHLRPHALTHYSVHVTLGCDPP
jgi:hypothetical protein